MHVKIRRAESFVGLVAVGVLVVGAPAVASSSTHSHYRATTPQSERVALTYVHWTSNVKVTTAHGSWTFTSDGLPASNFVAADYAVPSNPFDVSAAGANVISSGSILRDQNYDYTLPLTPEYSKSVTTTNQGPIGVLLDGGALYNPYEANHATVATSDNFVATASGVTASFLDNCDGHPGPGGQYHYHGLPTCLVAYATGGTPSVTSVTSTTGTSTAAVSETTTASRRPVILGFAFDGYGIYDNVAMSGAVVPVSALDACNGIFSPVPGYPHGVYHYVLENVKGARSSIGCYHGVVSSAYTHALENELDGSSPRSTSSSVTSSGDVTAWTLAANKGEDTFLLTMLGLRGLAKDC